MIELSLTSTAWMADALCAQIDHDSFYPAKGEANASIRREVCARCDVRAACLAYALEHNEDGIWGGTTPRMRKRMKKAA